MKIAFFGYDYTLDIAQRLMGDGHEIVHIHTFPCDNVFSSNLQIKEFAKHFGIPCTEVRAEKDHLESMAATGCTLFLCAGYPFKIPEIEHPDAKAINLHPSLLPRVRGVMPLPYIIMKEPKAAGYTIHKLTWEFDKGDILYQEAVPIDEHTDIETLSARIAVRAPMMISEIVENIDTYWNKATPQDDSNASVYMKPGDKMRQLDWNDTADITAKKGRAFGRFGTLAMIANNAGDTQKLGVFNLSTWMEKHAHEPGKLIRSSDREIIVAIKDGYACLKEFHVLQ